MQNPSILIRGIVVHCLLVMSILITATCWAGVTGAILTVSASPGMPLSWSCGSPTSSPHCLAVNYWDGGPINGADTTLDIVALVCHSCSDIYYNETAFLDNELWIEQKSNSRCSFGVCWVEAGYVTQAGNYPNGYKVSYFWADNRPSGGYYIHYASDVNASDYGHPALVTILKPTSTSTQFNVSISAYVSTIYGTSTNNSMSVDRIQIGSELAGTSASSPSAPKAHFTHNHWINTSGTYKYQTVNGAGPQGYNGAPPPRDGWTTPPSSSPTGGDMYTYCCS